MDNVPSFLSLFIYFFSKKCKAFEDMEDVYAFPKGHQVLMQPTYSEVALFSNDLSKNYDIIKGM